MLAWGTRGVEALKVFGLPLEAGWPWRSPGGSLEVRGGPLFEFEFHSRSSRKSGNLGASSRSP